MGGSRTKRGGEVESEVNEKKKWRGESEQGLRSGAQGKVREWKKGKRQNYDNLVHGGCGQCQVRSENPESPDWSLYIFNIQMPVSVFCQVSLIFNSMIDSIIYSHHIDHNPHFQPFWVLQQDFAQVEGVSVQAHLQGKQKYLFIIQIKWEWLCWFLCIFRLYLIFNFEYSMLIFTNKIFSLAEH